MATWLEGFHQQTDLNRYPVALRTRSGIGYKVGRKTVSNFVGHPVHYFENGLWKPITLQRHANGDLEGSDYGWNGGRVTYKKRPLFQPRAVIFNGTRYNLSLRWDGNRLVSDLPFGMYEVLFTEKGVKELLIIPEPIEGLIEFDVPHAEKPAGLFKKERHIIGGSVGESFYLTKDMSYPLVIDPDYSSNTADTMTQGYDGAYATARATAYNYVTGGSLLQIGQRLSGGFYEIYRTAELFDTSGIPDSDSISQVVMSLYLVTKYGTTTYDIQIKKYDWSASNPIGSGNYETVYDGILSATLDDNIWKSTSSISDGNRYSSGNLATIWVNKTGYTYYALMSSRDASATTPTGNEFVEIASQDNATSSYRPVLTVTHAAAVFSSLGFRKFAKS